MIYKFACNKNVFFLTADNKSQLYKRIQNMYCVSSDSVKLLAEYKETDDYRVILVKEYDKNSDNDLLNKAAALFAKSGRRSEPYKTEYIKKYNFKVKDVEKPEDLICILQKYKKVKVYWDITEKRGIHSYYVLYK